MATCMGLNEEEAECIKLLKIGYAIVSMKGRTVQPLHIGFPEIHIRKGKIKDNNLYTQ